ncbi:MAG: hypothetical protein D6814_05505 [Calditrichaeota bacterium]|nr:MAG: hypothetical protein D6814_05505 [Calditrichota bacterium]
MSLLIFFGNQSLGALSNPAFGRAFFTVRNPVMSTGVSAAHPGSKRLHLRPAKAIFSFIIYPHH